MRALREAIPAVLRPRGRVRAADGAGGRLPVEAQERPAARPRVVVVVEGGTNAQRIVRGERMSERGSPVHAAVGNAGQRRLPRPPRPGTVGRRMEPRPQPV